MIKTLTYKVSEIEPYINWLYFFHAWEMSGKPESEKNKLRAEAETMLSSFEKKYTTRAIFGIFDANSDGDDIIIGDTRIPMLRQQNPLSADGFCLSLADFVRPASSGIKDRVGVFAVTVDPMMEFDYKGDPYLQMLSQTLADRLAEATAEKMHLDVRTIYWGYAPDEHLSMADLLLEKYQGIRPAIGYPSLPDTSVNFILSSLLNLGDIGIHLTDSGMMVPHASVSGFMFAHPQARYFDLGKIGEDQLRDYARRRNIPVELMRRFLQSSLIK
jgi:cobalamin-dependent methionine synthase I